MKLSKEEPRRKGNFNESSICVRMGKIALGRRQQADDYRLDKDISGTYMSSHTLTLGYCCIKYKTSRRGVAIKNSPKHAWAGNSNGDVGLHVVFFSFDFKHPL